MKYANKILQTFEQYFLSKHFYKHKWVSKLGNKTNNRDFQCFQKIKQAYGFVHSWQNITYSKNLRLRIIQSLIKHGQALLNQALSSLKSITIWNQTDLLRMSTYLYTQACMVGQNSNTGFYLP